MGKRNIRDLTKDTTWNTETVTNLELQTSALMRIADSAEETAKNSKLMAQNHIRLQNDLNFYESGYRHRGTRINELEKSNAALRGVITRMKNKKAKSIL